MLRKVIIAAAERVEDDAGEQQRVRRHATARARDVLHEQRRDQCPREAAAGDDQPGGCRRDRTTPPREWSPRSSRRCRAAPHHPMPSTCGHASGFDSNACSAAPARPSAPPTAAASTTRGSRASKTMTRRIVGRKRATPRPGRPRPVRRAAPPARRAAGRRRSPRQQPETRRRHAARSPGATGDRARIRRHDPLRGLRGSCRRARAPMREARAQQRRSAAEEPSVAHRGDVTRSSPPVRRESLPASLPIAPSMITCSAAAITVSSESRPRASPASAATLIPARDADQLVDEQPGPAAIGSWPTTNSTFCFGSRARRSTAPISLSGARSARPPVRTPVADRADRLHASARVLADDHDDQTERAQRSTAAWLPVSARRSPRPDAATRCARR